MSTQIISTKYHNSNRVVTCIITAEVDGEVREFSGSAVRHSADKNLPALGRTIAEARAYSSLANRLIRRSEGFVRHQDNILAAKQKQTSQSTNNVQFVKPQASPLATLASS